MEEVREGVVWISKERDFQAKRWHIQRGPRRLDTLKEQQEGQFIWNGELMGYGTTLSLTLGETESTERF